MQFQNPRCAFVTTNIRNVVVVIITATANFLLAPAPLLHHVWQGQGWPSEWWRPRTWCWDDVVCAMWRQNGMIHAWSRRIRTQAPWNGPHSTHVWGHGLVHTWSHVTIQEQDTHWASPCPLPGSSRDSCPWLCAWQWPMLLTHARYERSARTLHTQYQTQIMDSSSTGWFSLYCFVFIFLSRVEVYSGIEKIAFNFSPEKWLCV